MPVKRVVAFLEAGEEGGVVNRSGEAAPDDDVVSVAKARWIGPYLTALAISPPSQYMARVRRPWPRGLLRLLGLVFQRVQVL